MKYIFGILLLLSSFFTQAQTVKGIFSGYANIQAVTGSGPTYTLNITSFVGSPQFQPNGPWLAADVQVGDVIWLDCARFVITTINSTGPSTMNIVVEVPSEDWALGVSSPLVNQRVAVVHEMSGVPSLPPPADGNAGALSGIDGNLYSCLMAHYSWNVDRLIKEATEVALVSGTGIPSSTLHTVDGYNLAKNGMGDGDLYEWNGTAFVKNERSGGEPISVKSYAVKNSVTPASAFNSLLSKYLIEGGDLVVDTTVNITSNISTSSLITIHMAKGGLFNISTGITLTINGLLEANPAQQIFTWAGTGNVQLNQKIPIVYPYWFGAKNDGTVDCYASAQKAINVANTSNIKVVEFFAGDHPLSKGLLIKEGTFSSLELRGSKSYDGGAAGTQLRMTDSTTFCIGVQGARAVKISGFYIRGWGSTFNPDLGQLITYTNQQFRDQWGRNSRYSPYSGIVIDPFQNTTLPPDGGYPGFTSEYTANNNTLSSNVVIEHCVIRYFIVGIALSPSQATGNGSEINIDDVHIDRCQYGLITCQTQARAVNFTNGVIAQTQINTDGRTFGNQQGPFPLFQNIEFGYCKQILNYNNSGGDGKISNMYCESVWQIGHWSGNFFTLTFDKCEINFTTPPESGVGDPASILDSGTKVNFFGGYIGYSTYRPIETNVKSLNFYGTSLRSYVINNADGGLNSHGVNYDNCRIDGYLGNQQNDQFKKDIIVTDISQVGPRLAIPGFKLKYPEYGTNDANTALLQDQQAGQEYVTLLDAALVVTVNHTTHTASFTTTQPGKYRLGDFLTSYNNNSTVTPSGNNIACSFGKVSSIVGNVITCDNTPLGISSGTYNIYLFEMRYIIPAHRGTIISGTNKLVVTSKATNRTVAQMWPVGARVYHPNSAYNSSIYQGLHVASVVADTIFLSGNSGSTLTDVEIFSAPIKTTYYSSDNTYQETGSTYRNVGYRTGDQILFASHAYRHSAVVTAGGFTPTVKFLYKPISGTTGARPTPTSLDVNLTYYNTTTSAYEVWNGTTWVSAGADNWGSQTVVTTGSTLSGNGTSGSPLQVANLGIGTAQIADAAITAAKINSMSASAGQVLKYNGSAWAPGSDDVGGGGGATNITITHAPTSVTVNSDSGGDGVINPANATDAGVMVPAQFNKLANISITQPVDLDALETASHAAVTKSGENYLTLTGQAITANAVDLSGTNVTGTLAAARFPSLTGDVTNTAGTLGTTISNNAVTSAKILDGTVSNSDLATMPTLTFKGNNTGGTAAPLDLTVAQTKLALGLNLVENTALSTWTGSTNITTVGTISAGTWNGTTIGVSKGGTGLTATPTNGQIPIGNGTGYTLANLTGTTNRFSVTNGAGSVTLDIASNYAGQNTINTLGTVTTGVWNGTTIAIGNGGTGQTTASAAFNALSPVTSLGDLIYGSGVNTNARLGGNTTTTKLFLTQTGNGTVSAAPAWAAIVAGDIPTLNQNTTGSAGSISGTNVITNSNLSTMPAYSVKANNTTSTATPVDIVLAAGQMLGRTTLGTVTGLNAGGDVTGDYSNLQITTGAVTTLEIQNGTIGAADIGATGVTAGSYTNPNVTVNAQGQVTSISNGSGGSGDNWGSQVVEISAEFTGAGTVASPLALAQNGATSDQALKWNGTNWAPGNDTDGQTFYEDDRTISTLDLGVSGGNIYSFPAATASLAGLMTGDNFSDIADLTTLSGVASNAVNLGIFTGVTIPDNQTIKQSLQALETAVESGTGAPLNATYITQTPNATLSNEQALSALSTGLMKVTTTTGVISTAVAGTDYQAPLTNPVTGTGTNTYLTYWSGTNAVTASNNMFFTGNNLLTIGDYNPSGGISVRGYATVNAGAQVITASNNRPLTVIANYSTTTNNTSIDGINTNVSLTNDGTTTGHQIYGARLSASASSPSSAAAIGGATIGASNTSANVAAMYGVYARIDGFTTSGSTENTAGRFDAFKQSDAIDFGTYTGYSGTVADNTATGRILTGYGGTFFVSNAKTAFGGNFGTTSSKGNDNNVTGAYINNTVSGASVVATTMTGVQINASTTASGAVGTYYGINQASIPSTVTTAYSYYNGTAGRVYSQGNVSIGQDLNHAALSVAGSGATSATYAAKFHNSTGTDNLFTLRNDERIGILLSTPTATLHMTQSSIASVSSGSGTNAVTFFNFAGIQGGNSTATTGTVFGGNAGNGTIILGNGGSVTGNPTSGFGGNGGTLDFRAGSGGLANTFGGAGGNATFQSGDGGQGATPGAPGWNKIAAGNAAASSNGNGANVYVAGGAKDGSGADGYILLQATPSANTRGTGVGVGRLGVPTATMHLGENSRLTGSLAMDGSAAGTYKLTVPTSVTSYTMTMPAAAGTTGQVLEAVDNAGTLGWGNKSSDLLGYGFENTSGSTFQITGTKSNVAVQSGTTAVILPEIVASSPGSNQIIPNKVIAVSNLTSSPITVSRGGTSDNMLPGDVTQITLGKNQIAWFQSTNANSWSYLRSSSGMEEQVVTTGSVTISNDVKYFYYDPSSATTATITMPANPNDGDEVLLMFGGQIAVGSPVLTIFALSPNSGQTLYGATVPSAMNGGDSLKYVFRASTGRWYRIML